MLHIKCLKVLDFYIGELYFIFLVGVFSVSVKQSEIKLLLSDTGLFLGWKALCFLNIMASEERKKKGNDCL